MKRKLGINLDCVKNLDARTALRCVHGAGFDGFFTGPFLTDPKTIEQIANQANALGLRYEFIHAPYHGVNTMWENDADAQAFIQAFFQAVDNAKRNGVDTVILHSSSTWCPPLITEEGFQRFDKLIEYAEKNGVKVAIENLRVPAYYESLLARYENHPLVGFCYDCGHEHWCSPELPHVERYGNRLFCTHIHDNFGKLNNFLTVSGDLHLLPFDGNFDFEKMMQRLNAVRYGGALTLELKTHDTSRPDKFFKDAYTRIAKIAQW